MLNMKHTFTILTAFIACLACAAIGGSPAAAAEPKAATVTIDTSPFVYGYVKSSTRNCARSRQVSVFKVVPGKDPRVARGKTRRFQTRWQWSTLKNLGGRLYAVAPAKAGCRTARSATVTRSPITDDDTPTCPGTEDICKMGSSGAPTRFSANFITGCRSLTASSDSCDAESDGSPPGWTGVDANFHWNTYDGGIKLFALYADEGSFIEGSLPGAGSAAFTVRDARAKEPSES
ncbi:MAG: hypothetical protein ACSLFD_06845, partial [Solirubrobacterales bacterium]